MPDLSLPIIIFYSIASGRRVHTEEYLQLYAMYAHHTPISILANELTTDTGYTYSS